MNSWAWYNYSAKIENRKSYEIIFSLFPTLDFARVFN